MAEVPPELRARIVELRGQGLSLRQIGTEIGKSHQYVRDVLNDSGLDTSVGTSLAVEKVLSERDRRIIDLYTREKDPMSIRAISSDTGVAFNTVLKVLHDNGVEMRPTQGRRADQPRQRSAVSYYPDDATMEWLDQYAGEADMSLSQVVDMCVQRFRQGN